MSTLDCCSSLMMREEASAIRFSTVTVHVAIALPASVACAVMTAVPVFTPVMSPCWSTVATFSSLLVHLRRL